MSLATLGLSAGYICLLLAAAALLRWPCRVNKGVSSVLSCLSMAWLVVAYVALRGHWPATIGWADRDLVEPWERAVWPIVLGGWSWYGLCKLPGCSASLQSWLGQVLAAAVLLIALPSGASYADMLPGNTLWVVMGLVAIGANVLAIQHFQVSQAGRWALLCFTVQLLTVAAVLLACYGSLGEFALASAVSLALLAAGRALGVADDGILPVAWCSTTLACLLLGHVRIYSSTALPLWLAPLPLGLPALVAGIDYAVGHHLPAWLRFGLGMALSLGMAALVVGWLFLADVGQADW